MYKLAAAVLVLRALGVQRRNASAIQPLVKLSVYEGAFQGLQEKAMRSHVTSSSSSVTGFCNPLAGFSLLILEVSRSHTMTRHS